MKTIDSDIRDNQLKKAYLLFGQERYLLRQYRDKLIAALVSPDDTMNLTRFEGDGIDPNQLIDLAETLPFFADSRVIVVENSNFFSKGCDELADYLPNCPDTTHFIFCEKDVDKVRRPFKAVAKIGYACEFKRLDEKTLAAWIRQRLKRDGKTMDQAAYELFIQKTGDDMGIIEMELEKLIGYTLGREAITADDVEAMTSVQITDKIFDMIDAMIDHQEKKTFELYYDLLALKVAPVKILSLIGRHYRILLTIKSMQATHASDRELAQKAGVNPYFIRKYIAQLKGYSIEDLKNTLKELAELDSSFKSGNLSDQMAAEVFLAKHVK